MALSEMEAGTKWNDIKMKHVTLWYKNLLKRQTIVTINDM